MGRQTRNRPKLPTSSMRRRTDFSRFGIDCGSLRTRLSVRLAIQNFFERNGFIFRPHEIAVYSNDVHTLLHDSGESVLGVNEILIHRYYHQRSTKLHHCGRAHETVGICVNDVALLVLDRLVTCESIILLPWSKSTISVLNRRFPAPFGITGWQNCHVAGWGFTSVFGKLGQSCCQNVTKTSVLGPNSDMLRDADVSLMNLKHCNSTCLYGGNLLPGMLCAVGDGDRGQDACTVSPGRLPSIFP